MSIFKKASALLLSSAIALSLAGCSSNIAGPDISYGAEIDGVKVPAGIFISKQFDAYYDALNYTDPNEEAAETSAEISVETTAEETAETTAVLDKVIEGKAIEEWVNDEATKSMQKYVAVEKKFDELGLSFTDEEMEAAKAYIDSVWEYYGASYEEIGVGKNSQLLIYLNTIKKSNIFNYYYGEGGEKAATEEEIRTYLEENKARINFIEMTLKDGEGNLMKSDAKADEMTRAEEYVERIKGGEDFNAVLKEYNEFRKQLEAAAAENTEETAAEEEPEVNDNTRVIVKSSIVPSKSVSEKVFDGTMNIGDIAIVEDSNGEALYIVQKLDLFADENYYNDNAAEVRVTLKNDEFEAEVESWTANQTVVRNEAAYKKYSIKKFMGEE